MPKGDIPLRNITFAPANQRGGMRQKADGNSHIIVDKKLFQAKGLTIGRLESSDLMDKIKQLTDHEIHFQQRS